MLVLSRKTHERIRLTIPAPTGPITVWIAPCEIDHGKVRIAIDAPRYVEILREELIQEPTQSGR